MKKDIETDLISVIVPIFNVEAYLRPCIESILASTYTTLQIILVNDGSTDHSGEICDEYTRKYNPQIEMFARFKMKSSFHKTKRII